MEERIQNIFWLVVLVGLFVAFGAVNTEARDNQPTICRSENVCYKV